MDLINRLKIKTKLLVSFSIISILLIFIGLQGYLGLRSMKKGQSEVEKTFLPHIIQLYDIEISIWQLLGTERTILLTPKAELADEDDWMAELLSEDSDVVVEQKEKSKKYLSDLYKNMSAARKIKFSDADKALFDKFEEQFNKWLTVHESVLRLAEIHTDENDQKARGLSMGAGMEFFNAAHATLASLIHSTTNSVLNTIKVSDKKYTSTKTVLLIIIIIGVALSQFLGYYIAGRMSRNINQVVNTIKDIAEKKDLTKRIELDDGDEIGDLGRTFNIFVDDFNEIVRKIVESASNVAASSEEMSASINEVSNETGAISKGAEAQSNTINQSSSLINQIKSMASEVESISQNANEIAGQAVSEARLGDETVKETIDGMEKVVESSQQIERIIDVINEISEQTDLLALNAAIEAAKAGEQGKGFAVVSDEVRKLAEKSYTSTKEIKELIKISTENIHEETKYANSAGESLKKIINSVNSTSSLIADISMMTSQQVEMADEVSRDFSELLKISQDNSASIERLSNIFKQILEGADELSSLAARLNKMVSQFTVKNNQH